MKLKLIYKFLIALVCFCGQFCAVAEVGVVEIQEISIGDQVWAYDHETDNWYLSEVVATHDNTYHGDMVQLQVCDEQGNTITIDVTFGHPFLALEHAHEDAYYRGENGARWVASEYLREGDTLLLRNGISATVVATRSYTYNGRVHNLTVSRLRTYAVTEMGVLVHNDTDCDDISGLRGKDFEDWLQECHGGPGSFKMGGREFDGIIGNRWVEAKSGNYWQDHAQLGTQGWEKFKSDMGARQRIARDNGAEYEVHSNSPIPQHVKDWLDGRGITYVEYLPE